MKRNLTYASLAFATITITGVLIIRLPLVSGQEARESSATHQTVIDYDYAFDSSLDNSSRDMGGLPSYGRQNTPDSKIRKAVQSYQTAKTDGDKETAKDAVSTALSDYFEADMKTREQDIKEIEERVKKLREQLEKRRAAKAKIVDLQLQVVINEAEGLGFYGGANRISPSGTFRSRRTVVPSSESTVPITVEEEEPDNQR